MRRYSVRLARPETPIDQRCHPASERGRQDAHAPTWPVGAGLVHRLPLIQTVVSPALRALVLDARGCAAIAAAAALSPVSTPLMSRLSAGSTDLPPSSRAALRRLGYGGCFVRVLERARHAQGLLLGDNGVMRMMTVFRLCGGEGLGPALSGSAAGAACIERLLELVGVGQIGVGLHRLSTRPRRSCRRTEANRARPRRWGRAIDKSPARPTDSAEIGDGKERAVTGAHADDVAPAERAPFRAFGAEIEPQRHALHSPRLRCSLRRCGLRRDGHASAPCAAGALRGRVAGG